MKWIIFLIALVMIPLATAYILEETFQDAEYDNNPHWSETHGSWRVGNGSLTPNTVGGELNNIFINDTSVPPIINGTWNWSFEFRNPSGNHIYFDLIASNSYNGSNGFASYGYGVWYDGGNTLNLVKFGENHLSSSIIINGTGQLNFTGSNLDTQIEVEVTKSGSYWNALAIGYIQQNATSGFNIPYTILNGSVTDDTYSESMSPFVFSGVVTGAGYDCYRYCLKDITYSFEPIINEEQDEFENEGNYTLDYIFVNVSSDDPQLDYIIHELFKEGVSQERVTYQGSPFAYNFTNLVPATYIVNTTINTTTQQETTIIKIIHLLEAPVIETRYLSSDLVPITIDLLGEGGISFKSWIGLIVLFLIALLIRKMYYRVTGR